MDHLPLFSQAVHLSGCGKLPERSHGGSLQVQVPTTTIPSWDAPCWCWDWSSHEGIERVRLLNKSNYHIYSFYTLYHQVERILQTKGCPGDPAIKPQKESKPEIKTNKDPEGSGFLSFQDLRSWKDKSKTYWKETSDEFESKEEKEENPAWR